MADQRAAKKAGRSDDAKVVLLVEGWAVWLAEWTAGRWGAQRVAPMVVRKDAH